jgi:hypothetical protein
MDLAEVGVAIATVEGVAFETMEGVPDSRPGHVTPERSVAALTGVAGVAVAEASTAWK